MAQASRDENSVPTLLGVSNVDGRTPIAVYVDPVTHRLLVDLSGAGIGKLAATGTVDGSNTIFVFASAPSVIFRDGVALQETSSDGTINWTGTTTITLDVAPNFDIFGLG